jgi:epoxyqueuosine reductase
MDYTGSGEPFCIPLQHIMEMDSIREKLERLHRKARDLGFEGFGVARAESGVWALRYQEWVEKNFHGEMAYMARNPEKRSHPGEVLAGAKSVISLRMNYLTREKDLSFLEDRTTGDVSLYALNQDYHDVVLPRLKQLEAAIEREFPGRLTRAYVDTGPVLEKPLAEQAGLGWVGKHTNLVTEHEGSWYFLAEILVDAALPETSPAVDRCGTCQACIDICPTRAIVAPYVLDARRCISYLTIELKGVIPIEFRKAIGNRIYGCDDCQIVCPWNAYAVKTDATVFAGRSETWRLVDLMALDDEAFRQRFKGSPIKRVKRRGFLRNVAVALGNSGDAAAVGPLTRALGDEEPLIRAHVVWALGELLGARALAVFQEKIPDEADPWVTREVEDVRVRHPA